MASTDNQKYSNSQTSKRANKQIKKKDKAAQHNMTPHAFAIVLLSFFVSLYLSKAN